MSSEWFCRWTDAERQALRGGLGPDAIAMYQVLRFQMDFTTGLVGRRTPISWDGLAWELRTEINRGRGCQIVRKSLQEMRTAVGRLIAKGLLKRVGGDDFLCFLCPLASVASVRPNQTQQSGNRQQSTERNSHEASNGAGFDGFERTEFCTDEPANSTDIREVLISTPSQSSSTVLTGVGAGHDETARGVNRDRPAGSQACPLGRAGNGEEGSCRDQASPSHAGQLSQPGNPYASPGRDRPAASEARDAAQPLGTLPGVGATDAPEGLAENESAPLAALSGPMTSITALVEVLNRRAVRVPATPEVLHGWVAMGVTPLELDQGIDRAAAERQKSGSLQRLNVGYVASIIQTARSEARRAAAAAREAAAGRRRPDAGADLAALARQLGIQGARPGESMADFKARVMGAAEAAMGADRG